MSNIINFIQFTNPRARVISQLRLGNGKLFGKFEMSVDSVVVDYVLDQCSVLQCSHQCQYYFNQLRYPGGSQPGFFTEKMFNFVVVRFICLCPDKRNNANYVECKVDQGNNRLQETGITDTTAAST